MMHSILRLSQWTLSLFVFIIIVLILFYNFVFENYEVFGESVVCDTNSPIAINYTCKLDKIDNNTQYWSFESVIPEGFQLPNMMVFIYLFIRNTYFCKYSEQEIHFILPQKARVTTYHQHNGEYKAVFLKNTTIDICKHAGGHFSKIIVATFLPDMIEKSNMNQPCPFSVKLRISFL